jgi:hypothetical protein
MLKLAILRAQTVVVPVSVHFLVSALQRGALIMLGPDVLVTGYCDSEVALTPAMASLSTRVLNIIIQAMLDAALRDLPRFDARVKRAGHAAVHEVGL